MAHKYTQKYVHTTLIGYLHINPEYRGAEDSKSLAIPGPDTRVSVSPGVWSHAKSKIQTRNHPRPVAQN